MSSPFDFRALPFAFSQARLGTCGLAISRAAETAAPQQSCSTDQAGIVMQAFPLHNPGHGCPGYDVRGPLPWHGREGCQCADPFPRHRRPHFKVHRRLPVTPESAFQSAPTLSGGTGERVSKCADAFRWHWRARSKVRGAFPWHPRARFKVHGRFPVALEARFKVRGGSPVTPETAFFLCEFFPRLSR